jgi:hypothetical protein
MYWATRISMLAFDLALPPLAGYWLDRKLGTTPWLVVAGACLGLLLASLGFYRLTKIRFGSPRDRRPNRDGER